MKVEVEKIDSANATIKANISKEDIKQTEDRLAKDAAKNLKIDGFRKGKVPIQIVKARYGSKLNEDAKSDTLKRVYEKGIEELKIDKDKIIGEPNVSKFEENEGSLEVEIKISLRPDIKLENYKELIPDIKDVKVTKKEIDEEIAMLIEANAPLKKITTKRALKKGDFALIDFEGSINGELFAGGSAKGYLLEIGSGSFIEGFEDQMIGMKIDEQKDVVVTFPNEYNAPDLAGKEAVFKVTLLEIQEKDKSVDLDEELLKKLLHGSEPVTKKTLEEKTKEQIRARKLDALYMDEIKPVYVDKLVKEFDIDLPENIVEQEMDMKFRSFVSSLSEDEIKQYSSDPEKAKKKREEFRDESKDSVKLTFIVDELAKLENIEVEDREVMQTIYFEALQSGRDPKAHMQSYEKQGLLPAVKMAIVEDKLFRKLFDEKLKG